jgi:hypothetical protein
VVGRCLSLYIRGLQRKQKSEAQALIDELMAKLPANQRALFDELLTQPFFRQFNRYWQYRTKEQFLNDGITGSLVLTKDGSGEIFGTFTVPDFDEVQLYGTKWKLVDKRMVHINHHTIDYLIIDSIGRTWGKHVGREGLRTFDALPAHMMQGLGQRASGSAKARRRSST